MSGGESAKTRMDVKRFEMEWGGRTLSMEVGKLANQANGAVVARYGDTVVLATAVMTARTREGIDYFPLMVDLEEKLYAAGMIKSSRFMKREGRPSDDAILTGRMIDRALRPLFDERIRTDVQVIVSVLSVDQENDSDVPGFAAASAALAVSDIPWNGPIASVRVGRIPSEDGGRAEWVLNPTFAAREKSELDLVVAGTPERVIMLEAGAKQVSEDVMAEAVEFGQKHLGKVIDLISKVRDTVGKPKRPIVLPATDLEMKAREELESVLSETRKFITPKIREALFADPKMNKSDRASAKGALLKDVDNHLLEKEIGKENRGKAANAVKEWIEAEVMRAILEDEKRVDGRGLRDVRTLSVETGVLPRVHGSGLFQRGDTQVMSVVTLGAPGDVQLIEGIEFSGKKRYFHHYNFPPFSVGEAGPLRGPGRRDIGHGALAEKAVAPVLPEIEPFPYTIRVVSEVMASNGSSSMASTCGSSLALMDAGVPIAASVAGVAMGLASSDTQAPEKNYKIITDIQDLEDGKGGMDFKIAGTRAGITAIQLDTKTVGLTPKMVRETLTQARQARFNILDSMDKVISAPRAELSPFAPRIVSFRINPDRIRDVIGPGGKVINEIIDKTGVDIDIENDGLVMITSTNAESMAKAVDWVKNLTREVKVGEVFKGKVTRLMDFGAFVEILPKQEGLVHISELSEGRVATVRDAVNIGDEVMVKVIEIDSMGRINLSVRQAASPDAPPTPPQRGGPPRGGDRGPRRGFPFRPRG